jgi:hypothetical protein
MVINTIYHTLKYIGMYKSNKMFIILSNILSWVNRGNINTSNRYTWPLTIITVNKKYLDLRGSHLSLKLCSHCHQTIADFYHCWGLVNRQAYKAGESLNQIQLCHLLQGRSWVRALVGSTKDYAICMCSFSAKHTALKQRTKIGWPGIRIMCPSGTTCLSPVFLEKGLLSYMF